MLLLCFFVCFSCVFAVDLLLFVLFACVPPLLELSPAVLCHLRCCVCHIFTVCAVVPGVSPRLLVRLRGASPFFLEVAVYFLLLLLLLWRCGSVLLWCFCVAGVLLLVVLCGGCVVASCVWCVVGVLFGCSSGSVCVGSGVFWLVRCFVVLLVAVVLLVGCRGCVALSADLVLVCFSAPLFLLCCSCCSWFWLLVVLLVLLVVVGLVVLLLRCFVDPAPGGSGSWFNAECHPGWVAVWCFCSWRLWEFVSVCFHVVLVVFELVDSVWCVSGSAFYSL